MNDEHHYNRNIYFIMRTGLIAFLIFLLGVGAAAIFYSTKGVIYNPIFRFPAWFINSALGKTVIPSSTTEFTRLYNIPGYYIFTDIIVGVFYLFVAFVLSMYFAMFIIAWIYLWLDKCCLVYKLGVEGAKNYEKKKLKELQCQNENDKCLSALKSAQYEHWVQWKKFYKSDLSYEEWQEKIINK